MKYRELTKEEIENGYFIDKRGCFHDGGLGYNPNGVYCGECSMEEEKRCDCIGLTNDTE